MFTWLFKNGGCRCFVWHAFGQSTYTCVKEKFLLCWVRPYFEANLVPPKGVQITKIIPSFCGPILSHRAITMVSGSPVRVFAVGPPQMKLCWGVGSGEWFGFDLSPSFEIMAAPRKLRAPKNVSTFRPLAMALLPPIVI